MDVSDIPAWSFKSAFDATYYALSFFTFRNTRGLLNTARQLHFSHMRNLCELLHLKRNILSNMIELQGNEAV